MTIVEAPALTVWVHATDVCAASEPWSLLTTHLVDIVQSGITARSKPDLQQLSGDGTEATYVNMRLRRLYAAHHSAPAFSIRDGTYHSDYGSFN